MSVRNLFCLLFCKKSFFYNAVNAGYYDVSHFLKEVKTLSGGMAESFLSPTLPQEGLLTYIEK